MAPALFKQDIYIYILLFHGSALYNKQYRAHNNYDCVLFILEKLLPPRAVSEQFAGLLSPLHKEASTGCVRKLPAESE